MFSWCFLARIAKGLKFLVTGNADWSDCADAQAHLCLRWAHTSEGTFTPVTAVMILLWQTSRIRIFQRKKTWRTISIAQSKVIMHRQNLISLIFVQWRYYLHKISDSMTGVWRPRSDCSQWTSLIQLTGVSVRMGHLVLITESLCNCIEIIECRIECNSMTELHFKS